MANYNCNIKRQLKKRNRNFTQIPNEIFDADVSPKAKLIWIYLVSLQEEKDICQAYIGKKFGISKGAMKTIIQELKKKDLIEVTRKGPRSDYLVNKVPAELLPKDIQDRFSDEEGLEQDPPRTKNQSSQDPKRAAYKYEHTICNTTERERSGQYSELSSKETKSIPSKTPRKSPNSISPEQCLEPMSNWYQWLINKHGKIALHFPTLPYDERLTWAKKYGLGSDKEAFIDEYLRHYSLISGVLPETLDI